MRSNTTLVSCPRDLNEAKRWTSMNCADIFFSFRSKKAGLNRSICPTCIIKSFSFAISINCSACSIVDVIGFSINTCLPEFKASNAML